MFELSAANYEATPHLNQFVRLRPERDKVVFAYVPHLSMRTGAIHPTSAIALSLIDGRHTWRQIVEALAHLTGWSIAAAAEYVTGLLKEVDAKNEIIGYGGGARSRVFDPTDFLIPERSVNLGSRFEAPVSVTFKVTMRCKTDCIYCYAPRQNLTRKSELTTEEVSRILSEAKDCGVYQVNLCGGDCFARSDFVEIVAESVRLGLVTDLSTKVPLSETQAMRLADVGLDYIQVSIDCSVPSISDAMVRRQGHFAPLIASIRHLRKAGIFVRTNTVVTKLNVSRVVETIAFLADLGVSEMKVTPAFESFHADSNDFVISEDEAHNLERLMSDIEREGRGRGLSIFYSRLKPARAMTDEEKADFWFHERGLCSSGRSAMFIAPDGKVTLCEQVPHEPPFVVGDLRRQSMIDIWNSQATLDFAYPDRERFAGTICHDCEKFSLCVKTRGHCFRDSWFENATLYGPSPYCPKVTCH